MNKEDRGRTAQYSWGEHELVQSRFGQRSRPFRLYWDFVEKTEPACNEWCEDTASPDDDSATLNQ